MHEAAFRGWFVEAAIRDAMARANGRHRLAVRRARDRAAPQRLPGDQERRRGRVPRALRRRRAAREPARRGPAGRLPLARSTGSWSRSTAPATSATRRGSTTRIATRCCARRGGPSCDSRAPRSSSGPPRCGTRRARSSSSHPRPRLETMGRRLLAIGALLATTIALVAIVRLTRRRPRPGRRDVRRGRPTPATTPRPQTPPHASATTTAEDRVAGLARARDADRRTARARRPAARARRALPHLGPRPQAQPEPLDAAQRHGRPRPDAAARREALRRPHAAAADRRPQPPARRRLRETLRPDRPRLAPERPRRRRLLPAQGRRSRARRAASRRSTAPQPRTWSTASSKRARETIFVGAGLRLHGPAGVVQPWPNHDDHLHVRL